MFDLLKNKFILNNNVIKNFLNFIVLVKNMNDGFYDYI